MQRRIFLRKACRACLLGTAALLAPGAVWPAAARDRKKAYKAVMSAANEVILPLSLFAEQTVQVVSVKGWDYDMVVFKKEAGFSVFLLRCTHMDNGIQLLPDGFVCTMHGSTYDLDGQVTKGPAETPLEQYHATVNEDNLIITP